VYEIWKFEICKNDFNFIELGVFEAKHGSSNYYHKKIAATNYTRSTRTRLEYKLWIAAVPKQRSFFASPRKVDLLQKVRIQLKFKKCPIPDERVLLERIVDENDFYYKHNGPQILHWRLHNGSNPRF
jgi:hypothetical protein